MINVGGRLFLTVVYMEQESYPTPRLHLDTQLPMTCPLSLDLSLISGQPRKISFEGFTFPI